MRISIQRGNGGNLETIRFKCATAGTSNLHIVAEPDANGYGSDLYDELGNASP